MDADYNEIFSRTFYVAFNALKQKHIWKGIDKILVKHLSRTLLTSQSPIKLWNSGLLRIGSLWNLLAAASLVSFQAFRPLSEVFYTFSTLFSLIFFSQACDLVSSVLIGASSSSEFLNCLFSLWFTFLLADASIRTMLSMYWCKRNQKWAISNFFSST